MYISYSTTGKKKWEFYLTYLKDSEPQDWTACEDTKGKTTEGMGRQTDSLVSGVFATNPPLAIFPLSLCVHSKHTSGPALVINTSNHIPVLSLLWWLDHSIDIIFHLSRLILTLCFCLPHSVFIDLTASPFSPINTYFDICVAAIV